MLSLGAQPTDDDTIQGLCVHVIDLLQLRTSVINYFPAQTKPVHLCIFLCAYQLTETP